MSRVDVMTSTLGKALGGASGGFTTGRRKRSRCSGSDRARIYFQIRSRRSIAATTIEALASARQRRCACERANATTRATFVKRSQRAGFTIKDGTHPIVPVMIGDATLAKQMALALLDEGIYVIAFSYPVVPKDEARIRVQLSTCTRKTTSTLRSLRSAASDSD